MNNNLSPQQQRIMDKLNAGVALTNLDAWKSIGVYALSQRAGELIKKGYQIQRIPVKRVNRFGETVRITCYHIAPANRQLVC